ncbi:transposase, IS605 OrfB family protein (plasmid) [Halanaeroarchaeum sulfurireducens]|uniref:Transposase, IS605 OrfB family protein n=1 Tax=Halanaeroarchaeum sulfurireducens TaxID=1604004 RepID=A0A0F7PEV6_9EURY|nr:transposase, IS605 OrfB family protein [Halanaeroarchaeum sulfurireducens]ALG83174.1 transposase, IS605 OrfB family protein [Halanaeroarchaeum sulfurireducens]
MRQGLPVSTTHFTGTTVVPVGSAVSTGVPSECPTPSFERPRERKFHAVFASLSASKPQAGQECSRTQSGFSVSTPQLAHSFVVPSGSTSTKCVPSPHCATRSLRSLRCFLRTGA